MRVVAKDLYSDFTAKLSSQSDSVLVYLCSTDVKCLSNRGARTLSIYLCDAHSLWNNQRTGRTNLCSTQINNSKGHPRSHRQISG